MIEHTMEVCNLLAKDSLVDIHLAVSGITYGLAKKWAKEKGIKSVTTQGEGTLGLRMRRQVIKAQKLLSTNPGEARPAILIGTDLPDLSKEDLINAIEMLETKDLVIGPSRDGGYWLIGLSQKLAMPVTIWPFSGIAWGSKEVLGETLARAKKEEILTGILSVRNDLDMVEDLNGWQA